MLTRLLVYFAYSLKTSHRYQSTKRFFHHLLIDPESRLARVKRRCEMMHALLGAGTWLEQDREVVDLDRYRMTFPPGCEG